MVAYDNVKSLLLLSRFDVVVYIATTSNFKSLLIIITNIRYPELG